MIYKFLCVNRTLPHFNLCVISLNSTNEEQARLNLSSDFRHIATVARINPKSDRTLSQHSPLVEVKPESVNIHTLPNAQDVGNIQGTETIHGNRNREQCGIFLSQIPFNASAKNDSPSVQNEQSSCSNWTDPSVQNEQSSCSNWTDPSVQNEQTQQAEFAIRATRGNKAHTRTNNAGYCMVAVDPLSHPTKGGKSYLPTRDHTTMKIYSQTHRTLPVSHTLSVSDVMGVNHA